MSLRTVCVEVEQVEGGGLLKVPPGRPLDGPLLRLPVDSGEGTVYLDCARLTSVNGHELGALVTAHKRLREKGRRLVLCNVSPLVSEVFQVTRLCTVFEVRPAAAPRGPAIGASLLPVSPDPALVV
jgi:hypothetical protein